jgi:hypothetical protein
MAKRNMKNLSYILFAFVLFVVFFYMLNESKKKEQFSNQGGLSFLFVVIGVIPLVFIVSVLAAIFVKD